MVHDGNKQYGWTNIEPKYTSTAPELYRHLLAEERGISAMDTCLFGNPLNIHDLRKDVTDLMQNLHGKAAKAIPWDTRKEWVDIICGRVSCTTLESLPDLNSYTSGYYGRDLRDQVAKLKNDAWDLLYQVIDEKVKVIKRD
ncbi:unnamed protein product [Brassica rapa]|nr:unnamed protein product [Brassica napus]CAG7896119.1 unnamed protein product [Brassica rapa]CDY30737.1 BnaA02g33590D [Brassica napus]VDC93148.1 unnamed protein product [Brassica rapa]